MAPGTRLEIPHGIDRIAADPDLEVQVRAGRVARVARVADDLALADALADRDRDPRLVAVARGDAAAVVDAGVVAVAAGPAGDRDGAAVGGADRGALRDGDVDAGVQAAPAVAERRGERAVDGPDEAARALPDGAGGLDVRRRRAARRSWPAPSRARRGGPRARGGPSGRRRATGACPSGPPRSPCWRVTRPSLIVADLRGAARDDRGDLALARLERVEPLLGGDRLALASRTRSMIRPSWSETRSMNSARSSRSAKPSDSRITVTTSGLSAL